MYNYDLGPTVLSNGILSIQTGVSDRTLCYVTNSCDICDSWYWCRRYFCLLRRMEAGIYFLDLYFLLHFINLSFGENSWMNVDELIVSIILTFCSHCSFLLYCFFVCFFMYNYRRRYNHRLSVSALGRLLKNLKADNLAVGQAPCISVGKLSTIALLLIKTKVGCMGQIMLHLYWNKLQKKHMQM